MRALALGLGLLAAATLTASAQLPDDPAIRRALSILERDNAWTLEQQVSICEIPAPPFNEERRAAEYARRFQALGYQPTVDSIGNVIAIRKGSGRGRRVMIAGHLDTVFPEETDVTVKRQGGRYLGPGIGDDCRGLAVVLAVARAMAMANVTPEGDILFVGNVGEEGPGNLRGVRFIFERKPVGAIDAFISVDGIGLGLVTGGVGSNRYKVDFKGPGGHSYGSFGMPNPIHAMGRAIAAIADLEVPGVPRTTFSVGIVEGGTSINSIAFTGSMQVDLRSESAPALAKLDSAFRKAVDQAVAAERRRWPQSKANLEADIIEMGRRPAGTQPDSLWLVRGARAAAVALGLPAPASGLSSTDANLPISLGIPAITIDGGGSGGGAHSLGEWYEDGPRGYLGPQWALLTVWSAARAR
ncbi:MAG: M20/M25/M40 family metallo-hydrolase [Gemmatimonadales bacterium]